MPLIIPPVKKKNYEFYGELFHSLWEKAEDALAAAEHLIIIGYSFPKTDYQSKELLIKAMMRRTSYPEISILSPHADEIAQNIPSDYGIPSQNIKIYNERFTENYDLSRIFETVLSC